MNWQDIGLFLATLALDAGMWASLTGDMKPPLRWSAVGIAASMVFFTIDYSLGLYAATGASFIAAIFWCVLFVQVLRREYL